MTEPLLDKFESPKKTSKLLLGITRIMVVGYIMYMILFNILVGSDNFTRFKTLFSGSLSFVLLSFLAVMSLLSIGYVYYLISQGLKEIQGIETPNTIHLLRIIFVLVASAIVTKMGKSLLNVNATSPIEWFNYIFALVFYLGNLIIYLWELFSMATLLKTHSLKR